VIVKNLKNGKSVKVRINDRGPFIKGRIIDLTRAAFSQIANLGNGVTKVEIRVVK
jgi:rare lipoprotein A